TRMTPACLPPLPGILAEHFKEPPLDLAVVLFQLLRGKNGGEIFDGDRPISENSRFDFTFIFDLRLHKIPPIQSKNVLKHGKGQHHESAGLWPDMYLWTKCPEVSKGFPQSAAGPLPDCGCRKPHRAPPPRAGCRWEKTRSSPSRR